MTVLTSRQQKMMETRLLKKMLKLKATIQKKQPMMQTKTMIRMRKKEQKPLKMMEQKAMLPKKRLLMMQKTERKNSYLRTTRRP